MALEEESSDDNEETASVSARLGGKTVCGGYAVGGDLGIAFLTLWALWCIFYDSAGTNRPS
jgi:hypothetical protein